MSRHYATYPAFKRHLTTEFWLTSAAALGALSAIVLTIFVARLLGHAAIGTLLETGILPMLAFSYLRMLPVLLSLSIFLGIFISLTRQIHDHENIIWSNAGLAPTAWLRPILQIAIPATLLIALLSLLLLPWLAQKRAEFDQGQGAQRNAIHLTPGAFTESAGSGESNNQVTFIESVEAGATVARRVFIFDERPKDGATQIGVTLASTGIITEKPEGERFLSLGQGNRYEYTSGHDAYRQLAFQRYHTRLDPVTVDPVAQGIRQTDTLTLLRNPSPAGYGELIWRIGYPLSTLTLALLALPLSQFNPRSGRSLNAVFALLIYATYNNLVGLSESLVAQGQITPLLSLILLHGGAFALFYGLFIGRMNPRLRST
jgi:lipopolysaccharide export system permease protein